MRTAKRFPQRDLNIGAIIALAPNLQPFVDLLGVDDGTVRTVLNSWGPGKFDAERQKVDLVQFLKSL